jgi:hypothetical protein
MQRSGNRIPSRIRRVMENLITCAVYQSVRQSERKLSAMGTLAAKPRSIKRENERTDDELKLPGNQAKRVGELDD